MKRTLLLSLVVININLFASSDNGYIGDSGQTYQYDSSNYEDQIRYQYDLNAQQRDRDYNTYEAPYDPYNNRQQDQDRGQYGLGIYDNEYKE